MVGGGGFEVGWKGAGGNDFFAAAAVYIFYMVFKLRGSTQVCVHI